jgi:ribose-phosphate pyrophosphokinase
VLLAADALGEFISTDTKRYLVLSYLPHARADRRFEVGNAHPLAVFTQAIKGVFDEVFLTDAHSSYFENNIGCSVEEFKQWECFLAAGVTACSGDVLIAPDKGARKKIVELQQHLDNKTIATFIVEASKKRDKETGRIIETTVDSPIPLAGKRCIIVDDLSDGNGTFIPLAEKLKELGAKQVDLYVTHLIAAKGLSNLQGKVDHIYCYQIVGNYITQQDLINFNKTTGDNI